MYTNVNVHVCIDLQQNEGPTVPIAKPSTENSNGTAMCPGFADLFSMVQTHRTTKVHECMPNLERHSHI